MCIWIHYFNPRSREGSDAAEDAATDLRLKISIHAPAKGATWYYLVHNEGFTEEEARAIVAEAKSENEPKEGLFGEE